jgi:hypothetical protein
MNITIRLTKVEHEMLKELQKKDKRYKNGLQQKVVRDLVQDHTTDMGTYAKIKFE